jgi:hypothetical protein
MASKFVVEKRPSMLGRIWRAIVAVWDFVTNFG